jgi:uncharacterized SAM-binding protein YcdF (DUF218 family)
MLRTIFVTFVQVQILVVAALLLSRCTFSGYARSAYKEAKIEKPYDAIIVPGLPYDKDDISTTLKMRVFWAKHLYDSGFTRNVIFSGAAVYTPFIESIAMKVMADSLGIPSDHTFAETKAEHSTENVYYSWKMAKRLGFEKIALATDPFQSAMLESFMKKYTPGVRSIPVVSDIVDVKDKKLPLIDTTSSYVSNFVSIKERESFWQRLRGTMGKRVKEERKLEAKRMRREVSSGME